MAPSKGAPERLSFYSTEPTSFQVVCERQWKEFKSELAKMPRNQLPDLPWPLHTTHPRSWKWGDAIDPRPEDVTEIEDEPQTWRAKCKGEPILCVVCGAPLLMMEAP